MCGGVSRRGLHSRHHANVRLQIGAVRLDTDIFHRRGTMRFKALTCATALLLATHPAAAQRIADIAPGTLVRLSMRQGAPLSGPLAEVRIDSVQLSTTVRQAARSIPLTSIATYQYADGEHSHAGTGALIGGALGLALCFSINRDQNDWVRCNTMSARAGLVALFAFPGVLIGNGIRTPRWISAGAP